MKRRNREIIRLKSILDGEKESMESSFESLIKSDLKKLLINYFDFNDNLTVSFNKGEKYYSVKIEFDAFKIKKFKSLPK